jgi:hypothetical protein
VADLHPDSNSDDDLDGPTPRVAAAAIRDAIEALERERPDLAERLRSLLDELEPRA